MPMAAIRQSVAGYRSRILVPIGTFSLAPSIVEHSTVSGVPAPSLAAGQGNPIPRDLIEDDVVYDA
jgi:hypothetical protein